MNFLFRGFLSVKERLGKSIILFLVMTSICVFVLAGFSIESATGQAGILARQKLGATVSFNANMEKIKAEMRSQGGGKGRMEVPSISIDDVNKILSLDHINSYNLIASSTGVADGFTPITSSETESSSIMSGALMKNGGMSMGDLTLEGVSNLEALDLFSDGTAIIEAGEGLTTDSVGQNIAVIEESLANQNSLKVGDTIKVKSPSEENQVELKIVGIYKTNEEVNEMAIRSDAMNPYNRIYVPYDVANTLKGEEFKDTASSAQFYLDDPINVDEFIKEGEKLDIDFDTYILDGNNRAYETMMGSIDNVASFAKITVIVVSIAGAIILGLIIMLSIKERRNEIGILLSLGERKRKVVAQFFVEILLVLTLSLGVSAILGNTVSSQIGNVLMNKETAVQENQEFNMNGRMPGGMGKMMPGGLGSNKKIETIDELDVSVSPEDYGKMCGLAILIALVGVALPSSSIMRLQPKEILSKHD